MTYTLSLRSLLDSDKLIRSNFDSQYHKLKIILEHERILYVVMDPAPKESTANACGAMRDTYQKWLNDRTTMRCIMRAAMNNEFNHKFENAQPEEIL